MPVKDRIIEVLGEQQLLLPAAVARALSANDRVKYLLALLQGATATANGAIGAPNLRQERLAVGVPDPDLDRVIAMSTRENSGSYRVPGAGGIVRDALDAASTMLAPLQTAGVPEADDLGKRLAALRADLAVGGDLIEPDQIVRLTGGDRERDSLHLLVMDAHRALNGLAERISTATIDGARTHGLNAGDETLVQAFMRGLHSTEHLRFDHPGLATIATRTDDALVIQNDLGETDAHVVVIRVADRVVTINYTDVHLVRLLFFQQLLVSWGVRWEDTRSRSDAAIEGGLYHLASGRFVAQDAQELEAFLAHLGSRLVFMIDWNRARKRLRRLVRRRAAIDLLRWAAENGYGHIAFLRAGADGLVYEALEFAGGHGVPPGQTLEDVLGAAAAREYLRAVLRICSDGLLADRGLSLVRDEVRAELTSYLRSAREEILDLALRHAELSAEIAEAARDGLELAIVGEAERSARLAARARRAEHDADGLVTEARVAVARSADLKPLLELIEAADDIADCAEEAAFYATLLPPGDPASSVPPGVRRIAALVLSSCREYVRAVQRSTELRRGSSGEDMDAFLGAAHRIIALERDTDAAQREIHAELFTADRYPATTLFVIVELTRAFEEAADALMHSAHLLREHALARVVRSERAAQRRGEQARARRVAPERLMTSEDLYRVGDRSVPVPDADSIGSKAHGLARAARAGLRVPEAVVLRTSFARRQSLASGVGPQPRDVIGGAVEVLESETGLRLGSTQRPLLLSVRSGAPVSMPGMLDTVLDVGMCDACRRGMVALTGNPRLAWDSYRRLVESFAAVVHGCSRVPFEEALRHHLERTGADSAGELTARALEQLVHENLELFQDLTGSPFPQDPFEQLLAATVAVLDSWDSPRAREYRRMHDISDGLRTAIIIQRMVFGNAGGVSGSGVGFTRDPALGRHRLYMDFLVDAQGEDVVGGRHAVEGMNELETIAPELIEQLEDVCSRLETEFADAQEFEITVQEGELFLLQTRTAKRTPWAALQIASDQVHEGLISPATALARLDGIDLGKLRRLHVARPDGAIILGRGIPASIGVATGPVALDLEAAERIAGEGTPPVLVRSDTVTEDVAAVAVAAGLLTATGGRTSHAAVIARELGKPCLVGCERLNLDLDARTARFGEQLVSEGQVVCLDAESGLVFSGTPSVVTELPTEQLREVQAWREAQQA